MRSEATNQSSFEIAIGQQLLTPLTLAGDYKGRSPLAAQVERSWNEQGDVARSYLDKARRKMKKWADKRRRPKEYNLGDMVILKLLPQQFKSFRKVHKGLIRKYEGPFPIVAKVGKVSYRLELPPKLKFHPVFHVIAGDVANIILDPILIFACRLGVSGAAIAHVLSQYLISLILLIKLMKQVDLLPPSVGDLQFSRFLKNGFLLLARVIAATFCVTLAASLAARLGPTPMAAFQVCLQVWMTSSLLADGLAVAGQAILACAFAEKDYEKAKAAATRVLQMGFVLGLGLALVVGLGLQFGSGIFSKDKNVIRLISIGVPFVAATQPINSLAFVFDGVNFGASDFAYSAYSMVALAIVSIASIFVLFKADGFVGIWVALTIYMALRTFAGIW
ncbi:hypothetical protein RJ639_024922, partial [Escallonia herrerae]